MDASRIAQVCEQICYTVAPRTSSCSLHEVRHRNEGLGVYVFEGIQCRKSCGDPPHQMRMEMLVRKQGPAVQPRYTDPPMGSALGHCCWRIPVMGPRDPPLDEKQRGKITALQRILVCKMSLLCRRATETARDFFKRRERVATGIIERYGRSKWGALQKYRAMNFAGHVTRMDCHTHPVARAHRWMDLAYHR